MTANEKKRRTFALATRLAEFGLSYADTVGLLKCERALSLWAEKECGDGSEWAIERDDDGKTWNVFHGKYGLVRVRIPDRETGALKRANAIIENVAGCIGCVLYHQQDPRGCMIYLVPLARLQGRKIDEAYTCGIAICI